MEPHILATDNANNQCIRRRTVSRQRYGRSYVAQQGLRGSWCAPRTCTPQRSRSSSWRAVECRWRSCGSPGSEPWRASCPSRLCSRTSAAPRCAASSCIPGNTTENIISEDTVGREIASECKIHDGTGTMQPLRFYCGFAVSVVPHLIMLQPSVSSSPPDPIQTACNATKAIQQSFEIPACVCTCTCGLLLSLNCGKIGADHEA